MNQIFNPENFFWKCFDKMADVVGLSLLWFMCSLPVVTIGPACAALYDASARCVRGGEGSPYGRFLRTFRREFNISPISYLISRRIQESRFLLCETDHTLSQIAQILGFSSLSYFSQSFRRLEGVSPMEYRKRRRGRRGGGERIKSADNEK